METSQIREEFKQLLAGVVNDGVPAEQATEIARVILQESGKDRRTAMMNQSRQNGNAVNGNGNGDKPATFKQKKALQSFGVRYDENISKARASQLLDEAITKANSRNANGYGNDD